MFEQLKNWVKPSASTSISEIQKHENELIELFIQQSSVISENPDLPQKVKPQLDNIVFNLKQIDMMKLPIDIQVKIERILTKDIPFALETYFSLPKAHAVSVILDNGKTAKQTLIDQFSQYANLISNTWQEAIELQSKALTQNDKINQKVSTPKKDFFDL